MMHVIQIPGETRPTWQTHKGETLMMARFTLSIDTDNAAFGDEDEDYLKVTELARILRDVAGRLERGRRYAAGNIHDINGNRVGQYGYE